MDKKELAKMIETAYRNSKEDSKRFEEVLAIVRERGYHWIGQLYKESTFVIGGGSVVIWVSEDDISKYPKDWNVSLGNVRLRQKPYKLDKYGSIFGNECPYR